MSDRVYLSPTADNDVSVILARTSSDRADAAYLFLDGLRDTLALFSEAAPVGAPKVLEDGRLRGLRFSVVHGCPRYLLFYQSVDDGTRILRVLDGHRDIPSVSLEQIDG